MHFEQVFVWYREATNNSGKPLNYKVFVMQIRLVIKIMKDILKILIIY